MENNYCVYKHTSPSNKVYIGITCQEPEKRWKGGYGYLNNKHFTNAIKKYGWDNFTHEVLFTGLTKDEACQKEIELIAFYKSNQFDFGYNRSSGGESNKGWHHTEEARKKIGIASLGNKYGLGKESRLKGTKLSEEHRKKLSESHKGKISGMKGKKMSEESCRKIGDSKKGQTPWIKGKHHSDETKRKMSDNRKGKMVGENHPFFGKHHSDETRHKISNSLTGNVSPKRKLIYQYDLSLNLIKVYDSLAQAAETTKLGKKYIINCCKGRRESYKGFIWSYSELKEK